MTAQHPDWDELWKQIQDLLQHNPALLRKNINRRVKQIVCSARVQQRPTNVASKHPDWDQVWEQVQNYHLYWLDDYIKSHDINQCTDEQGNALLHRAVRDENLRAIRCLSHLCIDPNIKNAAGQTALQLAQDTGAGCIWTLHENLCIDFATASTKPNGLDALFAAIYRGDATLGDTSGVKNNGNEKNAGRWTALHCAVMYDRPHLIRALRERFPKLDANCSSEWNTALRLAIMRSHSNCMIALYECFPAIDAGDALHIACAHNRSASIPALRKCFPQLTGNELAHNFRCSSALCCAARYSNPEGIRALHSCFPDIDPNLQNEDGYTALIAAMQIPRSHGCIPVLSECFPNIDPNKEDNNGNTALVHACKQGLPQLITSLATYFPSIDVNMRNTKGKTALMLAIECNCNQQCLIVLCESFPNLDPNVQDDNGDTALMFAVRPRYHGAILSQLRKLFPNIDPNVQDKRQDTALMYLLRPPNCTVKCVSHFLDTFPNVDVSIQNAQGEPSLTIAMEQGKTPVVALLLKRFPDIMSITNSAGQTALMLEIKNNRINSISMLLKRIAQMQ